MPESPESQITPSGLDALLHWIREREAIRQRKEAGLPWPWTSDPLLRQYRWCNVRRADDLVSRELLQHWYDRTAAPGTQLAAAALARLVNWPAALLDASRGAPFAMTLLPDMRPRLATRFERGEKVFTGAYIVPGVPGRSKVDSVCSLVGVIARRAAGVLGPTMRDTWAALLEFDGLGGFLAGQIVADLALLPAGAHWPDVNTWAPVGPGSARGWNRITGRPTRSAVSPASFDLALPLVIAAVRDHEPYISADRQLIAMDLQSCLCEVDKFLRLRAGEGTVRALYRPHGQQSLI